MPEKADFNAASEYLRIVISCVRDALIAKREYNAEGWQQALDDVFLSIIPFMKDDEITDRRNKNKLIKSKMDIWIKNNNNGIMQINADLWDLLIEYHESMMLILKRERLLMKMMDDAEQALR